MSKLWFQDKKVVALYFSAHWCPPCRQFTPVLKAVFLQLRHNLGLLHSFPTYFQRRGVICELFRLIIISQSAIGHLVTWVDLFDINLLEKDRVLENGCRTINRLSTHEFGRSEDFGLEVEAVAECQFLLKYSRKI